MPKHRRKSAKKAWKHVDVSEVDDALAKSRGARRAAELVRRTAVVDSGRRVTRASRRLERQKQLDGLLSDEVYERGPKPTRSGAANRAAASERGANKKRKASAAVADDFDAWDSPAAASKSGNAASASFLDPIESRPVKRRRVLRGQVLVRDGTQVAHPGASVNPDTEQHRRLLTRAAAQAVNQEEPEERAKAALQRAVQHVRVAEARDTSGHDNAGDEESGAFDAAADGAERPVPDPLKRRTKVQLNRKRRVHEDQLALKRKKQSKALERELSHVGKVAKEVSQEVEDERTQQYEKAEERQRLAMEDPEAFAPKKLGKLPYVKALPSVSLPEDVTATLRKAKPVGSALEDAQDTLRRRRYVPVSKLRKPYRKYRQELYGRYKQRDVDNVS